MMHRNFIYLMIGLFAALGCSSCSSTAKEAEKPLITVTIEPLRYFTEAIAGDYFEVTSMVPKGSSPETYDPTPHQLVDLHKSKAYLRIGYIGFERSWIEKLKANATEVAFYDTSEGVDLIHSSGHWHGDHFHAENVEPHIWNSTKNAQIMADNICKALSEIDKEHQAFFQSRTDSLKQVIRQTDEEIKAILKEADKTFLIYHPALSYFARDYGLNQISIEKEGKEPSPSYLKSLIVTCKEEQAHVIFVQQEFDTKNAQIIADEIGVEVISINPLSYEWQAEMKRIAQSLQTKERK